MLRAALRAAEMPYTAVVAWRNRRYDTGRAAVYRVDAPVVCVGNLTLGGTGKTPVVAWLARQLQSSGLRVAIVSRGYKSDGDRPNDEALELQRALPDVPHVQQADRVAAAREAIARHGAQLIVLDDGFQHRRLARDLDIVLLDALEPFGFEHVFPRGTLREPVAGLARAQVIMLSRCDLLDASARQAIARRALAIAPKAVWVECSPRPTSLVSHHGQRQPIDALRDRPVAAFCGIGNPAGFRHTLEQARLRVVAFREFPDHHAYDRADLAQLDRWAQTSGAEALVCTQKDLVKIDQTMLGTMPVWALLIELAIERGLSEFQQRLANLVPQLPASIPAA